jgi:hypothetical protein
MSDYKIHFTIPEARAAIPNLKKRILRILDLLAEIRAQEARNGGEVLTIMRGNGKGPILSTSGPQKEEAQKLVESIAAEGIQIKDLEKGLVDFPHFLDEDTDHEVFLCWHLGEDTIEYWHEIADGFAGRVPLRKN